MSSAGMQYWRTLSDNPSFVIEIHGLQFYEPALATFILPLFAAAASAS
jgi:hypothetical protein